MLALSRFTLNCTPRLLVGRTAPTFASKAALPDGSIGAFDFQKYSKDAYTILYFYPLDFTFVCASETVEFHNRAADFESRGAKLVGVSVDSPFTHAAWKNTSKADGGIGTQVNHPLVSDLTRTISDKYGVLIKKELESEVAEEMLNVAVRGVFVIDKTGKVRAEMKNDLPIGRNIDEVLRILDSVIYTDTHGEVCPVNWAPGKPAMTPSKEGVAEYMTKHMK